MPVFGMAGVFTMACCGAFLLGQAVPVEPPVSKIFGMTVVEWVMLLGAFGTFIEALRQRHGRLAERGQKVTEEHKAQALREAFAETMEKHPEVRKRGREIATHKATKMGVSLDVLRALLESKDEDPLPEVDPEAETTLDVGPAKPTVDPEKAKEK